VSTADPKAAVRARFAAFNAADWTSFKDLIAPHAIVHFPGAPSPLDRDGWVKLCAAMDVKPPVIQISAEQQIAEGDTVATRWTIRGGPVRMHGVSIDRIVDGKVIEHREFFEQTSPH
jgi:predicted SnoaL-like aldol condensation-catalyzing enzyme